jgi:uncharacterized protein (TIGR03437 family)
LPDGECEQPQAVTLRRIQNQPSALSRAHAANLRPFPGGYPVKKAISRLRNLSRLHLLALILVAAAGCWLADASASGRQKETKPVAKSAQRIKKSRTVGRTRQSKPAPKAEAFSILNPFAKDWEEMSMFWGSELEEGEREGEPKRADEPDKAIRYFLQKRLPEGETELPVEKYFEAMELMQQMPVYSTVENRMVSRIDLRQQAAAPDQQKLGAWTELGPGNIGGRTRAILIHPQDSNIMYAAGVAGGVWKSTNAGQSWAPIADLIANIAVCSLAFDPKNPNIVYAGTGEGFPNGDAVRGAGIFKTTDAGMNWTRLAGTVGTANFYFVNDLIVSSNDSNRIYAATGTGIWRTTDGGANWTRVITTTSGGGCQDLAARTDQSTDYLLAACGNLGQATVFRKSDAAMDGTWESVLSDPGMGRTALAFAPSNQNIVYALTAAFSGPYSSALHAVFRSENGGGTWTARLRNTDPNKINTAILSNPLSATALTCKYLTGESYGGQSWYDLALAVDPLDPNRIWAGGIDVARSDDGGANWGYAAFAYEGTGGSLVYAKPDQLHPDQHFIVFHPQYNGTSNQQMFVGNDGGIWRTENARADVATGARATCDPLANKVKWKSLNNGYGVTQFYHGSVYPDGKTYLGGTQDNGTPRGSDAGGPNKWKEIFLADGGYSAVDARNPNTLYVSTQGGNFRKSTDNGASFSTATLGLAGSVLFITPLAMDPSDPLRLYTGGDQLFRTDFGMANWTNLGTLRFTATNTGTLSALAVAPVDANHAMYGLTNGSIIRTNRALALSPSNVLTAVSEVSTVPRAGTVSWIAYDPNDKNIAYATYSTFGGTHVWKTTNGGTSWTGLDGTGTGRIPDIPVHCLVVDPSNTPRLYVGTDLGVFASIDGGATWSVENTGFANVITESLVLNTTGGVTTLYAFTHGRGAYKVTTSMSGCNFSLSKTGQTVSLAGADATVDVSVTPSGCNWKAESNAAWITVQPGAGGSSNGTVGLKVAANPGIGRRFGTVSIAGRSFNITQEGGVDIESPTLRITTPTVATTNTTAGGIAVAGTAADNLRVASVFWRSNRGLSGSLSLGAPTTNWTFASIPLITGRNEITFTASDEAGNISGASTLIVNSMPASVLATVVGTGTFGYNGENLPATLANITNPVGTMFFDGGGNFYFAEYNGHRVRKVSPTGVITNVAGTGVGGFSGDGGKAISAQLSQARAALPDKNGNIYIIDGANNRVRRVDAATGNIATIAGTGEAGFSGDGGPATQARLSFGTLAGAMTLDAAGNLYIADSNNHRIRRIAADTGTITTIAGTGTAGYGGDNGPAASAILNNPQGLIFDKDGNLLLSDTGNFRIRKIAANTGTISTIIGTGTSGVTGDGGPATAATLAGVYSIALDAAGNLYLSDVSATRVRRVAAADNVINTVAGGGGNVLSPDGGGAIGAGIPLGLGIGIDTQGSLLIAEANGFRIRKLINGLANDTVAPTVALAEPTTGMTYTSTSALLLLRGSAADNGTVVSVRWSNDRGGNGSASGASSWLIPNVTLQPGINNITVTAWDVSGNAGSTELAVNYAPEQVVVTLAGTGMIGDRGDGGPGTAAELYQPRGVAVDSKGNIYVADTQNRRVRRISPSGQIAAFAGTGGLGSSGDGGPAAEATFNFPNVVIVDKADNVYISDQLNHRIRKVTPDGKISTIAGTGEGFGGFGGDGGPATAAQLNGQVGLAVDANGNLFIADRSNNRIRRIDAATGIITTIAGTGVIGGDGDGGTATQAELSQPTGVAVDGAGNVYITDTGNRRIRRVSAADGKISTIAGTGAAGFSGDGGPATSALLGLAYPATLAFDAAGDLYFADRNNHRIRKIALATGIITSVAGTGVAGFSGDGTGPVGTALSFPTSVAFDSAGNLIIADSGNNRVRRVRLASSLRTVSAVSAASFSQTAGLAAEEIGAAFGTNLAGATAMATSLPLPTSLAGTTVRVRDNVGVERLAQLFFVSSGQVNFLVPSGTANGLATVTLTNSSGDVLTGTVSISTIAPSLFSANANGMGVAAAVVLRRTAAGQDRYEPVAQLDSATNRFVPVSIDLGPETDQLFLIVYGTGFRGRTGLAGVTATIGGVAAPVLYAGPAPGLVGADQLNLRLNRSLAGKGAVDVVLNFDGKPANAVQVAVK